MIMMIICDGGTDIVFSWNIIKYNVPSIYLREGLHLGSLTPPPLPSPPNPTTLDALNLNWVVKYLLFSLDLKSFVCLLEQEGMGSRGRWGKGWGRERGEMEEVGKGRGKERGERKREGRGEERVVNNKYSVSSSWSLTSLWALISVCRSVGRSVCHYFLKSLCSYRRPRSCWTRWGCK